MDISHFYDKAIEYATKAVKLDEVDKDYKAAVEQYGNAVQHISSGMKCASM